VKVARAAARTEQSELVVHNRDGKVASKDSSGHGSAIEGLGGRHGGDRRPIL
jgi:hypothetical protein